MYGAKAVPKVFKEDKVYGFVVLEMTNSNVFKLLKLQAKDLIYEIDGEILDTPAKAMKLYNSLKRGNVEIKYFRNGVRYEQSIKVQN